MATDLHIDFTSDETKDRLYELLAELRTTCPVVHSDAHGGYWVVTRYADVLAVLGDWRTYTSTEGVTVPRVVTPLRAIPMEVDPPDQVAYRRALNPHLTVAATSRLEDDIRQICTERIDRFVDVGRCELVADFAQHIPSETVFRNLLGAAEEDIAKCHAWVAAWAYDPGSNEAIEAGLELMQWCYQLMATRKEGEARGDILDAIVSCDVNGRPVEDMEVVGMIALLIFGGFDTTANAIANAMMWIAKDPDLQRRLREDRVLLDNSVDEFLRHDPPVIGLARRAARDTELGGCPIKAGDAVYFSLASANRDPAEFEDPDAIRPDRERNRHLSFSAGVHRCVGAHLGRLMLRVALEELLGRLDDIRLDGPVPMLQGTARGPKSLALAFTRRTSTPADPQRRIT